MNNIHHSLESLAIDIDKLSFLEGNPRKGDIEAVAKSYKQFGQRKPIVATKDYVVIAGNHQLAAARQLGWDRIAVVITDDDELTAKAFALADNRTAELGSYDDDLLADLLSEVSSVPELMDSTGFSEDDLFDLIEKDNDEIKTDEELPEIINNRNIQLGDMYQLGNHYLLCGDATEKKYIEKLIKNKKINMVLTDPPYGMNLDTDYSKINYKGTQGKKYKQVIGDHDDFSDELITTIFKHFDYVDEIFIFGCDYFFDLIKDFKSGNILCWDKTLEANGDGAFNSEFELIWSKQKHKRKVIHFNWFRFFGLHAQDTNKRLHPTQKPLQVLDYIINKYSNENDNVIDLYGGVGSTLISAENNNRNCFMMELDPEYCDVIIERWENLTGLKAELIEKGQDET
jgi:DNA modification methylase